MTIPGMSSLHRTSSIDSITNARVEEASTSRQPPAIEARVSNQPVATSGQLRSASSERRDSAKASGALREAAGRLAARFQSGEHSLQLHIEQFALQGKLLKALPDMLYENVAGNLHEDLAAAHVQDHSALVESGQRVKDALELLGTQKPGSDLQTQAVVQALADSDQALVRSLEISHSRYEEALNSEGLSPEDKRHVESSRQAFIEYAVRVGTNTSRQLDACIGTSQQRLTDLDEELKKVSSELKQQPAPGAQSRQTELQAERGNWQAVHATLTDIKQAYNPPEQMKAALGNVKLPQILARYEQQRSYANILRAATPAAFAQLIASALHFGATRGTIESTQADEGFARRVGTAGLGLGVAHELVNNTVRPASQEVMGAMGGKGVRTVAATEVIPNPVRTFTRDGVVHTRTDAQMKEAKASIDKLRATFTQAQNNHKFGTMKGELTGFGSFGAAQLALEALVDAGVLPKKSIPALILASASGGFLMALLQTFNQLTTTVEDDQGRKLPTHVPKDVDGKLLDRLAKVGSDGVKAVDLREREVLEAFLSKIAGSIQGVGISTAVSDSVKHLGHDSPAHITSKLLVAGFGPSLTLSSFFAAMQTKPEAKKGGTGRMGNVGNNLVAPGRDTLPHTTAEGTKSRAVENAVHRGRGVLQAPSQAAVVATSAGVRKVGEGLAYGGKALVDFMKGESQSGQESDLELGVRNPPQAS
ncbi:hypothetical protein [Pseudomonas sp. LP_7_YM]|uniref:hypothetical protein n=1 Tax=Pseudomonas sp. LP_7_YM TaxID=2485137 RepID=UPI00105D8BC9|nr:hypothetical protein [Pseudomonas sp. LP_7_YM]TDV60062.1 hypothetical protein EC915_11327 [Pseudomonas sp. LP_7_YM]